jgi:hypothetical protein
MLQEKGDSMFLDVLSGKECSDIISEIAYELFVQQKYPIDIKPAYDMQAINNNEAQIKSLLDSSKITKNQAVYWSTMCTALVSSIHFIEWSNQFEQPKLLQ